MLTSREEGLFIPIPKKRLGDLFFFVPVPSMLSKRYQSKPDNLDPTCTCMLCCKKERHTFSFLRNRLSVATRERSNGFVGQDYSEKSQRRLQAYHPFPPVASVCSTLVWRNLYARTSAIALGPERGT
jgi:hypothetical protein